MNGNKGLSIFTALVCTAVLGVPGAGAYASDSVNPESQKVPDYPLIEIQRTASSDDYLSAF